MKEFAVVSLLDAEEISTDSGRTEGDQGTSTVVRNTRALSKEEAESF